MEIGSRPAITPPSTAQATSAAPPAISSDFETFIKMLTVQVQNQDPLNPIESTDFAVQLATFSTVEQQVLTNNLLTTLGDRLATQALAPLSGWIGLEARAEMPVAFEGRPVELYLNGSDTGETVQLVVQNVQGTEIQRYDVPPGGGKHIWQGTDVFGNALPHGQYNIHSEIYEQDDLIETVPVQVYGQITGVRQDDSQPMLQLRGGQIIDPDQVAELRVSQ